MRPADANETAIVWREIITRRKPAGLALSRQNLPTWDRTIYSPAQGAAHGAYVLHDSSANPSVILIATGSEVAVAVAASQLLQSQGIAVRVVSAPCLEWFAETDAQYQESVLPRLVTARVSIEAGVAQGWREYVGDAGEIVSLNHFGASASANTLFAKYGFTAENVAQAAIRSINKSTN